MRIGGIFTTAMVMFKVVAYLILTLLPRTPWNHPSPKTLPPGVPYLALTTTATKDALVLQPLPKDALALQPLPPRMP